MRRLIHWLNNHLALLCMIAILLFVFFYVKHNQDERKHAENTVCAITQNNDNGLLSVVPKPNDPLMADKQRFQVEQWAQFVEQAHGSFHCKMDLVPPTTPH